MYRSDDVENIGYVIPTTVVSHFLDDYERNGKYTGERMYIEFNQTYSYAVVSYMN